MASKFKTNLVTYFIVVAIWSVAILIKLKFNGLVFGFDYGLFHPDGALYTTRTLDWSGYSETESANKVASWYNTHAFKFNSIDANGLLYTNHPLYLEYSTRVLYPILSIPFVKLLGIPGMLVIPALSLLVLMLIITKMAIMQNKRFVALLVLCFITSSSTVMRWMMSNTTDALLVGLFAVLGYLISKRLVNPYWYIVFSLLILLTGLTRISILFWIAIAIIMWIQKLKVRAIYISFLSIVTVLPTLLTHQGSSFLAVEGERPIFEKILLYPLYLFKIVFYEFSQLYVLDRGFFFICIYSIFLCVINIKKDSSKFLLCILAAGFLTGALNGNVGVNFRYQLPSLFFICWSLIDNLNFSFNSFKRLHINRKT